MSIETAIRDAIFEVILPAYANPSVEFVCRVWPGQAIDARQYGNAWSPTNPTGITAATENLSAFVDPIPNLSNTYSKSGRTVEDKYGQVVTFGHEKLGAEGDALSRDAAPRITMSNLDDDLGSTPALPAAIATEVNERTEKDVTMPDGKVVRTIVLSEDAKSEVELARKHADQAALLKALNAIKDRYPAAEKPALQAEVAKVEQSTAEALRVLQGFRTKKAGLLNISRSRSISVGETPSIDSAFYKARTMFEKSFSASVKDPLLQYHPSYLSPEDWTDKQAAEDWNIITIPIQVDGSRVNLSVTFSRVEITRPWFLMSLFDLPDWETNQKAGSLSNGDALNNPGSFSLLPLSMIVARGIKAVDAGGTTLFQANGLQVLAWINKVMPFSPH